MLIQVLRKTHARHSTVIFMKNKTEQEQAVGVTLGKGRKVGQHDLRPSAAWRKAPPATEELLSKHCPLEQCCAGARTQHHHCCAWLSLGSRPWMHEHLSKCKASVMGRYSKLRYKAFHHHSPNFQEEFKTKKHCTLLVSLGHGLLQDVLLGLLIMR